MNASVTYTGDEVAILAGIIAGALPALHDDDFEVADLLLDKALAQLPRPLSPELESRITRLRVSPTERFWARLIENLPRNAPFDIIAAGVAGGVTPSRAWMLLEQLHGTKPKLRRVGPHAWEIMS